MRGGKKEKERRQRSGADVLESYQHKLRIPWGREERRHTVVYRRGGRKKKPSFDAIGGGNQITKLRQAKRVFF
jgi:hypothetical protein